MRAEVKVENPDEVEITISMTGTLRSWRLINEALKAENSPAIELSNSISQAIREITDKIKFDV